MEAARSKTATPAPAPAPAPAAHPVRTAVPSGQVQLQSALKVSSPSDPAEKEAESTARRIVSMPKPAEPTVRPQPLQSPHVARFRDAVGLQRKAEGQPNVSSNVAAEISASTASGSPLPASVRRFMEPRFKTDFGNVRVHTGERAARLNRQVSAQAFTVGNQIFFGRGRFQPEASEGQELIAHELTHTIQQGAAVQRSVDTDVAVTQQSPPQVQRLGLSDALDYFADRANNIPGFRMFTVILGVNPINMSRVDRSAANILRAVIEILPGGALITQALDNHGVFDRVGAWVEQQIRTLGMTGGMIRDAIDRFLDSLSWTDIFDLGGVWDRAKRIFTEPIDRIFSFVGGLVTGIIGFIKDAILRPLARLAEGTRGYDLLKAVLGRDPITGDPVPRNAETLIGGFMRLIGQEEIWQNIQRSGAVARTWAWFQGALSGLMGFVQQIPSLFIQAFRSLELTDIILVPRAFARIISVFGGFAGRFFSWAGETIWNLLEIIFSVVAPGVMVYLRRAAGAFRTILRNPIGFVGNLVRAGILGLRQFARNFLRHLNNSLIRWLTGAMNGANIYIPQALNLREILKFVLSVLGLTWQNIRQKLVRAVGETTVRAMETGFDIVMTLVTQGPAAAWEKILESLSNLREMVMGQIMTFVRDQVIERAITQLVTSLNPVGAFIQAIIAIYNTVMFFVERLRQIAQVARSVIDSIAAIASGVVTTAANRVEETMAGLLTLVISFLARLAGLGGISEAVTNVVNRVRAPIDRALDRVVEWIVAQARRLGRFIMERGGTPSTRAGGPASQQVGRSVPFATRRESHRLWVDVRGNNAELMVASGTPMTVTTRLNWFSENMSRVNDPDRARLVARLIPRAQGLVTQADQDADQLVREQGAAQVQAAQLAGAPMAHRQQEQLGQEEETLAGVLLQLFDIFEIAPGTPDGSTGNPNWIKWHKGPSDSYTAVEIFDIDTGQTRTLRPHGIETVKIALDPEAAQRRIASHLIVLSTSRTRLAGSITAASTVTPAALGAATAAFEAARIDLEQAARQLATTGRPATAVTRTGEYARYQRARRSLETMRRNLDQASVLVPVYRDRIVLLSSEVASLGAMLAAPQEGLPTISRQIGIAPQNRIFQGRVVGPKRYAPGTLRTNQAQFRRFLESAGYNWSGFDADHVTEFSLSGPDSFDNLWPYASNITPNQMINMATGKQLGVGFAESEEPRGESVSLSGGVQTLWGKYFIIRGF